MHFLTAHAADAVERYGCGLAVFNEASAESIHPDFHQHYQRYAQGRIKVARGPEHSQGARPPLNSALISSLLHPFYNIFVLQYPAKYMIIVWQSCYENKSLKKKQYNARKTA